VTWPRGGNDATEVRFRRGNDARSIPAIRISGEKSRDTMQLAANLVDVLNTTYAGIQPTMVGGAIVDRCRQLGYRNVVEVNFGGKPPDDHYANNRSYMWSCLPDWAGAQRHRQLPPIRSIMGPQTRILFPLDLMRRPQSYGAQQCVQIIHDALV
jgi:hypothetical protein